MCVIDIRSLSRSLWIAELTERALGSEPPDTDIRTFSKPEAYTDNLVKLMLLMAYSLTDFLQFCILL
jgi:hypothetical protein